MMKAIYCAGEQGCVTLDILRSVGKSENVVFADDDQTCHGKIIQDSPVIGSIEDLPDPDEQDVECIVAFGDGQETRLEIANMLAEADYEFFNAIHNYASISESANLRTGVTINAQSYVGPGVSIHKHVLIDSCVNISHGVQIAEGATITPGTVLSGGVSVGKDVYIGPNATITEDRTIGERAVVGAGAVVTEDVSPETTVVGVPASPIDS